MEKIKSYLAGIVTGAIAMFFVADYYFAPVSAETSKNSTDTYSFVVEQRNGSKTSLIEKSKGEYATPDEIGKSIPYLSKNNMNHKQSIDDKLKNSSSNKDSSYYYSGKIGEDSVQFSHAVGPFFWANADLIALDINTLTVKKPDGQIIEYIDDYQNDLKLDYIVISENGNRNIYRDESSLKKAQKEFDDYCQQIVDHGFDKLRFNLLN